jgi:hypothetical protein
MIIYPSSKADQVVVLTKQAENAGVWGQGTRIGPCPDCGWGLHVGKQSTPAEPELPVLSTKTEAQGQVV